MSAGQSSRQPSVLELHRLRKTFKVGRGPKARKVRAVDDVSLTLDKGTTLAVVGESGSGKTTLARLAMSLLPPDDGDILLNGRNLTGLSPRALARFRPSMQMVFQDPFDSLAPWHTAEQIVGSSLHLRRDLGPAERRRLVVEVLERVGLPQRFLSRYPHELSGGQAQRVGIARAIVTRPSLVVLDEPTSALDMSVQAQILALLHELQNEEQLSYLFISHDLAVVRYLADRTAVMRRGQIVEVGDTAKIFDRPENDYTRELVEASPRVTAAPSGRQPDRTRADGVSHRVRKAH
ncbi:ATP-binding cassette domain-containing protein [Phytohabitans suffuscus]